MNLNIENLSITSLDFEKNLVFSQTSEICDTFLPHKACFSSRFHTLVSFFLGGLTVVHRSSNILDNKKLLRGYLLRCKNLPNLSS